jgi:hypothetical protein
MFSHHGPALWDRRPVCNYAEVTLAHLNRPRSIKKSAMSFPILQSEDPETIAPSDREKRVRLAEQLQALPADFVKRLQYIQPQIGCFNRCAFCSQEAGRDVWQLTRTGLKNLFAALAFVDRQPDGCSLGVGTGRVHRSKVLFPYMDNDIASYPYLDEYIEHAHADLGCKVRLATVGYCSANEHLRRMHARIAGDLTHALAAVRFSFTPYTLGWTEHGAQAGFTARDAFIKDFADMLRTYRPALEAIGADRENGCCVELRFAPHVVTYRYDIFDAMLEDHHVVAVGPHLLVAEQPATEVPESRLLDVVAGAPLFSSDGARYWHFTSDTEVGADLRRIVRLLIRGETPGGQGKLRPSRLFRFRNADGPYC